MRCGTWMLAIGCGLFGLTGRAAIAEDSGAEAAPVVTPVAAPANRYIVITNRNAFGIKPPPVPPDPAPVVPATPPPNLFLTGLSFLHGSKRAYLVVNKAGGKQPEYLSVEEGYDSDGLQVLDIDPRKQAVRVRNAGNEVTLNFKDNGLKANAVPVGAPGMPPGRGLPPPPGMAAPTQPATASAPTIIGRGGATADNAAAAPVAALDAAAAGGEVPAARQLPSRRGVYLGGSGAGGGGFAPTTGADVNANLPVAPSRPGQLTGSAPRGNVAIPPIPGQ